MGTTLVSLKQKDFYKIIWDKKRIPIRMKADGNIGRIQACVKETLKIEPTPEKVWMTTKHKDFMKKVRDFLWKKHPECIQDRRILDKHRRV